VAVAIREYQPADEEQVVALSLRAWAPVFASMASVLGPELDRRMHGDDWREYQAVSVRAVLKEEGMQVWVAALDGDVAGFAAATVRDESTGLGELVMLAVDPAQQTHGLGLTLTDVATDWLRDVGMRVAMIGTGGDEGHAPARRTYEKANYTLFPSAQYFKAL